MVLRRGDEYAGEFYAGWLTEYSLSVDNLFVFLLIMRKFRVPEKLQQSALLIGIVIAIVLRGIFIALGAAAINAFAWVFYIFGAFLIYTAVKLAREGGDDDDEFQENRFLSGSSGASRRPRTTHGAQADHQENGKRLITPMFIVILALGHDRPAVRARLDPGDLRADQGAVPRPHRQHLRADGPAPALLPHRRPARAAGLPQHRPRRAAGVHRRQADPARHAREHLPFINGGQPVEGRRTSRSGLAGAIVVILGVTTVASLVKTATRRAGAARGSLQWSAPAAAQRPGRRPPGPAGARRVPMTRALAATTSAMPSSWIPVRRWRSTRNPARRGGRLQAEQDPEHLRLSRRSANSSSEYGSTDDSIATPAP